MPTIKNSSYTGPTSAMTTELNSLASTSFVLQTTSVDNTTNLDMFADVELLCTYGVAPTAGSTVDLYIIPSIDGTNFADGSSVVAFAKMNLVGGFELRAVTTAQRILLRNIPLPPGKFFWAVVNNGGQAFAASGNTLRYATHNLTST